MSFFVTDAKNYIRIHFQKYIVFRLIMGALRIIGLIAIWTTVSYCLEFAWPGIVLLSVLLLLYIVLEFTDFKYKRDLAENILQGREDKWLS